MSKINNDDDDEVGKCRKVPGGGLVIIL